LDAGHRSVGAQARKHQTDDVSMHRLAECPTAWLSPRTDPDANGRWGTVSAAGTRDHDRSESHDRCLTRKRSLVQTQYRPPQVSAAQRLVSWSGDRPVL